MNESKEQFQMEVALIESEIKEMKQRYKDIMKSVKGKMSDQTRNYAKITKKCIKDTEKELRKAKIKFYLNLQ